MGFYSEDWWEGRSRFVEEGRGGCPSAHPSESHCTHTPSSLWDLLICPAVKRRSWTCFVETHPCFDYVPLGVTPQIETSNNTLYALCHWESSGSLCPAGPPPATQFYFPYIPCTALINCVDWISTPKSQEEIQEAAPHPSLERKGKVVFEKHFRFLSSREARNQDTLSILPFRQNVSRDSS